MHLEHLFVDGVRNLVAVSLEPHRRLTILVGDNGQGKTNLLEAVHLAAALRPLRPVERAADLVGFGKDRGVIRAQFDVDGPLPIEVVVEPRGRKATVAGKNVRDVGEVASRIGVVSFVPDDAEMIRGGPDGRRRGLDRFAFSLMPGFAAIAKRFEDALERRNRVLKAPIVDEELLESYDAPFAEAAAALTRARSNAAARWAPAFRAEAKAIGGDALEAEMRYAPAIVLAPGDRSGESSESSGIAADEVDGGGGGGNGHVDADENGDGTAASATATQAAGVDASARREAPGKLEAGTPFDDERALSSRLLEMLGAARAQELKRRTTAVGPHHDDVVFLKADRKARFLASQGEARALVLAMKLAAVRLVTEARATGPLLLLDDVAGELDPDKAARLFRAVDETGAQVFVTTTHGAALPTIGDGATFHVVAGRVERA